MDPDVRCHHHEPRAAAPPAMAYLCVLASGSEGNCSALILPPSGHSTRPTIWLIDAGLSPRRTRHTLSLAGLDYADVAGILLTHMDTDHWHIGWRNALNQRVRVLAHRDHVRDRAHFGMFPSHVESVDEPFDIAPRTNWPSPHLTCKTRPILGAHDESGVCSYRFDFELAPTTHGGGNDALDDRAEVLDAHAGHSRTASLGFATDIGRITPAFIEHFREVDVLAIESNYCHDMQLASDRPDFLKRRIMGGWGHLSNHQAAAAIHRIQPRDHVIFLHLSRDCNEPAIVAAMHEGADYQYTIADQHTPTRRVPVKPALRSSLDASSCLLPAHIPQLKLPFVQTRSLIPADTATA